MDEGKFSWWRNGASHRLCGGVEYGIRVGGREPKEGGGLAEHEMDEAMRPTNPIDV